MSQRILSTFVICPTASYSIQIDRTQTFVFVPGHTQKQSENGHSPLAYGWGKTFAPQAGTSQDPGNVRS